MSVNELDSMCSDLYCNVQDGAPNPLADVTGPLPECWCDDDAIYKTKETRLDIDVLALPAQFQTPSIQSLTQNMCSQDANGNMVAVSASLKQFLTREIGKNHGKVSFELFWELISSRFVLG